MEPKEYLEKVLQDQKLEEDSDELNALRDRRDEIEGHLREAFGSSPTIRYGGSQAKGTLIKDSYDLDIVCYFPRDDEDAGGTLKDIFNNAKSVLEKHYFVEAKTSALRVKGLDHIDFHVDVVPGRFIAERSYDVYLYCSMGDKERLKTNIDTHIAHVKDSGVTDAIKLMKLWRTRNGINLKTFVLELVVIDILNKSKEAIDAQILTAFTKLRDDINNITVEDPANPSGNDLSEIWNDSVKDVVSAAARSTLYAIETFGWEAVFGKIPENKQTSQDKIAGLRSVARTISTPMRPWCR